MGSKTNCFILFIVGFYMTFPFWVWGQPEIAVYNQDSVQFFIEDQLIEDNDLLNEQREKLEMVGKECISFLQTKHQWALKRIEGGCISAKEQKELERYILYIHQEVLAITGTVSATIEKQEKEFLHLITTYQFKHLKETRENLRLHFIINQEALLYQSPLVNNLTPALIQLLKKDLAEINTIWETKNKENDFHDLVEWKNDLVQMEYSVYKYRFEN